MTRKKKSLQYTLGHLTLAVPLRIVAIQDEEAVPPPAIGSNPTVESEAKRPREATSSEEKHALRRNIARNTRKGKRPPVVLHKPYVVLSGPDLCQGEKLDANSCFYPFDPLKHYYAREKEDAAYSSPQYNQKKGLVEEWEEMLRQPGKLTQRNR